MDLLSESVTREEMASSWGLSWEGLVTAYTRVNVPSGLEFYINAV